MHHHQRNHGARAPGLAAPELAAYCHRPAPQGAAGAPSAGLSPPEKDEAPRLAGAEGFSNQEKSGSAHCARSADVNRPDEHCASLAANSALARWSLHELAGGGFLRCKRGMARKPPDLSAVPALLRRMGVQA